MINNDPSSLDHPPTPYPFSPGHDAASHSVGSSTSAFTFRSSLDFHHSGQLQQAEEEEVGLIKPRASPEVTLGPVLHPEGGEKDVRLDERVGVIGGTRGKGEEEYTTGQELFPSPPPSHESSPSIQFSFNSPSGAHVPASRDASSVSQASTTAVDSSTDLEQAERENFADFRSDGGGEGEDGLGLELRKGRKNLKRYEHDAEHPEGARGRLGGMMGSRSLRDGLKTDRPISTVSTSSTHAHLGSPHLPYFLPSSHSKPNLTPSSGSDAGSAVSNLRLPSPPNFQHDHSSEDHSSFADWETSPDGEHERARNNTASSNFSDAGSLESASPTLGITSSSSSSPTTSFLIGGAEEARMNAEVERKKSKKAKQRAKEKEKKKVKGKIAGSKGGK